MYLSAFLRDHAKSFGSDGFSGVICVMDNGIPSFRFRLCPDYKAYRKKKHAPVTDDAVARGTVPDELPEGMTPKELEELATHIAYKHQASRIHEVLEPLGVSVLSYPGWEADDVIAALCMYAYQDRHRIVLSADKDLRQLARPDRVTVVSPRPTFQRSGRDDPRFDYIRSTPLDYTLRRAVVGDSSDGLKGVAGVAEKTLDRVLEDHPFHPSRALAVRHKPDDAAFAYRSDVSEWVYSLPKGTYANRIRDQHENLLNTIRVMDLRLPATDIAKIDSFSRDATTFPRLDKAAFLRVCKSLDLKRIQVELPLIVGPYKEAARDR